MTIWAEPGAQDGRSTGARRASTCAALHRALALRRRDRQHRARRPRSPTSGASAFAHKGGVHGAATAQGPSTPTSTSTRRWSATRRASSSASWPAASTSQWRARAARASSCEGVATRAMLSQLIKELEARGLPVRGRRGLVRAPHPPRTAATTRPPFELRRLHASSSSSATGADLCAEATVKVEVEGEVLHTAADGNGPVNALDARAAQGAARLLSAARRRPARRLQGPHPRRRRGDGGQDAGAHRLIRANGATWSTGGSDTNIIAASWQALGDSLEYALWKSGAESPQRRDERHFTTASPGGR